MTKPDVWLRVGAKCCQSLWISLRDLLPIIITVTLFQLLVFRQGLDNLPSILFGVVLVVVGLSLFIAGLQMALFPIGEQMAKDFAKKGSVPWIIAFAFALGFGTTFAEPALIAIASEAASLAGEEAGDPNFDQTRYALTLRSVVAMAVGIALVTGVMRILWGWPLHWIIIAGYCLVMVLTPFAPTSIIGVAYDAGGVTTSTITVPLTTALGVGLASCIRGRNPLLDGFGLIALASLTPIICVLILGMFTR
jgi:MFS family permease